MVAGFWASSMFAADGTLRTSWNRGDYSRAGAVTMQGKKIIASGFVNDHADSRPIVVRLNANGSLDGSFGSGGQVTLDSGFLSMDITGSSYPGGLVVASDNSILVGCSFTVSGGVRRFAVVKLTPNGALDTTFNPTDSGTYGGDVRGVWYITGGTFDGNSGVASLVLQSDGSIVAGGYATISGTNNFLLLRLSANGQLDTTGFNAAGTIPGMWYKPDASAPAQAAYFNGSTYMSGNLALVMQPGGKILASGTLFTTNVNPALIRFTSAGIVDTTFNASGSAPYGGSIPGYYVLTSDGANFSSGEMRTVCLDLTGNILAGGYAYYNSSPGICTLTMRLTPDGVLDTTYNAGGSVGDYGGTTPGFWVITNSSPIATNSSTCEAITVDLAGRIIFTGQVGNSDPFVDVKVATVRLTSEGKLDTTFNPYPPGSGNPFGGNIAGFYYLPTVYVPDNVLATGFAISSSLTICGAGLVLVVYTAISNANAYFLTLFITDKSGFLQDTDSPFSGSTDGLIVTTTVDQNARLVVAGKYNSQSQITRYNLTGSPRDTSFSGDGVALGDFAGTATINKVINAAGGQYFVAGVSNSTQFTTALYDNSGTLNGSYGTSGIVRETTVGASAAYDMLLDTGTLSVCGYVYTNTPVVINYDSTYGTRDTLIGSNGLQEFSYLGNGTIYGINTTTGTSRYGAVQGTSSNTAFVRLLVNGTGVLQDTASPFNTSLAGLITTTTIDQSGKLLVGGNYDTGSQLTRYNVTGSPRDASFGSSGVVFNSLVPTATINKVINKGDGYLIAGVSNTDQFTVAAYTSSGGANTSFNTTGTVTETLVGASAAYDMLLNGTALAVSGYVYTNTPVIINYDGDTGARDSSLGNNGLQQFSYLGNGVMYGITTITGALCYGAGQGTSSNTAFVRLLVNGVGLLQDTAVPFDTGLSGLIMTTTIDQNGKLLAGGNYDTGSQLTRYNITGTPRDSSFGSSGVVFNSLVPTATINKVINNGTGYLVAGVSNTDQFTVAAYTSSGGANTSFNTTGTVRETFVGVSAAYDMLLNGTALAVSGYVYTNTPVVINYNSQTGAHDPWFGPSGLQQFPSLGNGTIYGISTTTGTLRYGAGQGTSSNTAFVHLLVNGTGLLQDTAAPFNTSQPGLIYSTTITQTGRILAAVSYNSTWQVVSYLSNAERDTGFGTSGNGVADEPGFAGNALPVALAVDSVGRIIVAGSSSVLGTDVITIVRYYADGTVDTVVQESLLGAGCGFGIVVHNDDAITIVGTVDQGSGDTPIAINYDADLTQTNVRLYDALIPGSFFGAAAAGSKYYAAGVSESRALVYPLLDGTGLLQDTEAPFDTNQDGRIYGGCIDQDDNITMCGNYGDTWMLVKYTSVGERYVGFGSNGVVLQSSLGTANAYAVHQDVQGNYFVAGESTVGGTTVLTVVKYANDGSPVTAFGTNGVVQLTTYGQSRAFNLSINANGSILVVGQVTINGTQYAAFIAYDATGNLIGSFGTGGVQVYSQFGAGSLYANLVNTSGSAIGAGQMGSVATLLQTPQESVAATYVQSGM